MGLWGVDKAGDPLRLLSELAVSPYMTFRQPHTNIRPSYTKIRRPYKNLRSAYTAFRRTHKRIRRPYKKIR